MCVLCVCVCFKEISSDAAALTKAFTCAWTTEQIVKTYSSITLKVRGLLLLAVIKNKIYKKCASTRQATQLTRKKSDLCKSLALYQHNHLTYYH